MATIQLDNTPHGLATKEALETFQLEHPTGVFGIEAMPGSDPVQNVTVLGDLTRAGLIEQLGSNQYQLTQAGLSALTHIKGEGADASAAGPMVCITSWPYDEVEESRRKATELFERLEDRGGGLTATPFPFDGGHEVALIDAGNRWMVAVGGLPDKTGTLGKLDEWFDAHGGTEQPTSNEFYADPNGDLAEFAGSSWGRVVDTLTVASP